MCFGCGDCCRRFTVVLNSSELSFFLKKYPLYLQKIGSKTVLRRTSTGSCIFQVGGLCVIQNHKPLACKLWPFHFFRRPLQPEDTRWAEYDYQGQRYYVYVDTTCAGVGVGFPVEFTIRELVRILEGEKIPQVYSTSPKFYVLKSKPERLEDKELFSKLWFYARRNL